MTAPQEHSKLPEGYQLGSSRHLYRVDQALANGGFANTYVCTNLRAFCPSDSDTVHDPKYERLPNIEAGRKLVIKEHYPVHCVHRKGEGETDTERYTIVPNTGCESMFATQEASFFSEANALWKLYKEAQCPNIVPVLHAAKSSQTRITYFVMPFLTGGSLNDWKGRVSPGNVMFILCKLLNALKVVHGKGMQHRDIKPKNVMLARKEDVAGVVDGEPVLIDFGLVETSSTDGLNGGTIAYMPWEQLRNARNRERDAQSGPWTDFYSLGVTCYELITGSLPPDYRDRNPWTGDSHVPLSQQPEYVERFGANLLLSIDWAMRIDYKKRWQSAEQWLEYLAKIQQHSAMPGSGVPDLTPEPLPLRGGKDELEFLPPPPAPAKRSKLVPIVLALAFLALVVAFLLVALKELGLGLGAGAPAADGPTDEKVLADTPPPGVAGRAPSVSAIGPGGDEEVINESATVEVGGTGPSVGRDEEDEPRAGKTRDSDTNAEDEFKKKLMRGIIEPPRRDVIKL